MSDDLVFHSRDARNDLFLEAKYLVEDQFPDVSGEAKLQAITRLVLAYSQLLAARRIASDTYSGLSEATAAIYDKGLE